jgi:hypothetical protein
MNLEEITPVILTLNEEPNIGDTIARLDWAKKVIVIDSFSDDATCDIVQQMPNTVLLQNKFVSLAQQWNFGLSHITTPWAMSLDADYKVTSQVVQELKTVNEENLSFISVPLVFCVAGKPLNCSILPPRKVLFRLAKASFYDDGHRQRLNVAGHGTCLSAQILHNDRKSAQRWFSNQLTYAQLESQKLLKTPFGEDSLSGKIRHIPFLAAVIAPVYVLIIKRGVFEFWQGWLYALMRGIAEILISLAMIKHILFGRRQ